MCVSKGIPRAKKYHITLNHPIDNQNNTKDHRLRLMCCCSRLLLGNLLTIPGGDGINLLITYSLGYNHTLDRLIDKNYFT